MKPKYLMLSMFGLFMSLTVMFVLGYSLGYNQSFRLQNANTFSALVSTTETMQKVESLLSEGEIERAMRLIRITIESHRLQFKELKTLQGDAHGILIPSSSRSSLVDHIMEPAIKRENNLLKQVGEHDAPAPSE